MPNFKIITFSLAAALLAACSGGSTEDANPFTGLSQSILGAQPSGTARMRGTAIAFENGRAERLEGDGTLDLDTGAAQYADGAYTLIDPDGFNSDGQLTDGTVTIAALEVPPGYSRVRPYIRPATATTDWSAGVIGFRSKAAKIATSGTASYSGPASLFVLTGAGASPDPAAASPATATLDVDFGASSLDLAVTGVDPALTGGASEIRFDSMEIHGALFRAGTLAIPGGLPDPTTLGTIGRSNARGQFFGRTDAAGHPDEAGGALFVAGSNATLVGVFVAD